MIRYFKIYSTLAQLSDGFMYYLCLDWIKNYLIQSKLIFFQLNYPY